MFVEKKRKSGLRKTKLLVFIILALCGFFLAFGVYRIVMVENPVIHGYDALERLPRKKDVKIKVDSNFPIKDVLIEIIQGENHSVLVEDSPNQSHKEYEISINPKKLGLHEGEANAFIKARSGMFSKTELSFPVLVDTIPPVLSVLNSSYLTHQGSTGAVLMRAEGADTVYVRIGEDRYQGNNEVTKEDNLYFVLFPVSMDLSPDESLFAIAEDLTGNRVSSSIPTRIKKTDFKKDVITISDDFITKKIYPIIDVEGEDLPPLEAFKRVNESMRRENEAFIMEIGKESSGEMHWEGKFLQMRNSKVFSNFGETRNYVYNGDVVSESRHLGYDLASTSNVEIEASNSGVVAFAGLLGIYGNTVIIDHGIGLMTMYAHLSTIDVATGELVEKSATIGRSGMTGLAGGDHLHFAVLVHGVYVSPLPWWDKKWIEKRILDVLHSEAND